MTEYYTSIHNKGINAPANGVIIADPKYIYQTPVTIFVTVNLYNDSNNNSDNDFVVTDANNVQYFNGSMKSSSSRINMYNAEGSRVLCLEESNFNKESKIINGINNQVIGSIEHKNSTVADKYNITFFNSAVNKEEVLSMNCDYYYRCCGIFQGKEKEGAPMICKVEQIKTPKKQLKYQVDISENVDNVLMIILAMRLGLLKFNEKRRRIQNMNMEEMDAMYSPELMNELSELDHLL